MIYLLDTDTVIYMMRGLKIQVPRNERQRERQATGQRIFDTCRRKSLAGHVVALSAITVAELEHGACHADDPEQERELTRKAISPFTLFDFTAGKAARFYGEIRSSLELSGKLIGPNDMLIGSHAMALDATLVTHNTREFTRIKGLKCRDWSLPPGA